MYTTPGVQLPNYSPLGRHHFGKNTAHKKSSKLKLSLTIFSGKFYEFSCLGCPGILTLFLKFPFDTSLQLRRVADVQLLGEWAGRHCGCLSCICKQEILTLCSLDKMLISYKTQWVNALYVSNTLHTIATSTSYWETGWIALKIIKDVFTFLTISWILFNRRRPNLQWSNPTCCLSYTDNTMPANALATLGARASAGMVLTPKAGIFHLQHEKS